MNRIKNKKNKGFSLVEIAIVLVIIGLLVGGVLKGQALILNAKIEKVVQEAQDYTTMIYAYQFRYGEIPAYNYINGDLVSWAVELRNKGFGSEANIYNGEHGVLHGTFKHSLGGAFTLLYLNNSFCLCLLLGIKPEYRSKFEDRFNAIPYPPVPSGNHICLKLN